MRKRGRKKVRVGVECQAPDPGAGQIRREGGGGGGNRFGTELSCLQLWVRWGVGDWVAGPGTKDKDK